jgi:hypothetical protein
MSNQRPSFAKRDREMKLKDKAKMKAQRRAMRKAEKLNGGPPTGDAEGSAGTGDGIDDADGPDEPNTADVVPAAPASTGPGPS